MKFPYLQTKCQLQYYIHINQATLNPILCKFESNMHLVNSLILFIVLFVKTEAIPIRQHKTYFMSFSEQSYQVFLQQGQQVQANISSKQISVEQIKVAIYEEGLNLQKSPAHSFQYKQMGSQVSTIKFKSNKTAKYTIRLQVDSLAYSEFPKIQLDLRIVEKSFQQQKSKSQTIQQFFFTSLTKSIKFKVEPKKSVLCINDYMIKFSPPKQISSTLYLIRNQGQQSKLITAQALNQRQGFWLLLSNFDQNETWHLELRLQQEPLHTSPITTALQIYETSSNQKQFSNCCMDKGFYPNFKNLKCQASSGMKSNGIKVQLPNTLNIFPNSMIRFNVTSDNKQSNLRNNWQIFNRPNNAASKQPQTNQDFHMAIILGALGSLLSALVLLLVGIVCIKCKCLKKKQKDATGQTDEKDEGMKSTGIQSQRRSIHESQCPICLQQKCDIDLKCGHHYHALCLIDWLKKRKCCPICRSYIRTAELREKLCGQSTQP